MDPLERVLIVAVSAAAAAAGKYQKTEEFCRLRNAVDARVSKFPLMIHYQQQKELSVDVLPHLGTKFEVFCRRRSWNL